MGDWPTTADFNRVVISPASAASIGSELGLTLGASSGAYPAANRAIYIPFVVFSTLTVVQMLVTTGTSISGSVDVGIYDDQGTRIVSKGSTALTANNITQTFDITDTTLSPGVYYMALSMNNTTGALQRWALTNGPMASGFGVLTEASAFPLPATATFATAASGYIPVVAVSGRTVL